MRTTKYVLVIIGILGMIASLYMGIVHKDVIPNISSFIASLSLLYVGFYKVVPSKTTKTPIVIEKSKDSF